MGNVQTCTLASCTIKESLSESARPEPFHVANTHTPQAAKNATATLCQQPVRDNTAITPIITAVSGLIAVVCVLMRLADKYPHWERLQWADLCVVISLVSKAVHRHAER